MKYFSIFFKYFSEFIFRALPIVKDSDLYSWGLPNSWNISFNYYYILLTILPLYIVIFPQLYSHMFRQVEILSYFEIVWLNDIFSGAKSCITLLEKTTMIKFNNFSASASMKPLKFLKLPRFAVQSVFNNLSAKATYQKRFEMLFWSRNSSHNSRFFTMYEIFS